MTAQHLNDDPVPAESGVTDPDPIGPITLPRRGRAGARALALVGTASVAAMAVHAFVDCTTHTSIQDPH